MAPDANNRQRNFWREFLCLWTVAAAISALSTLLLHLPPPWLQRMLWVPPHSQSTRTLLIAFVIQNSIHLAIAVGAGLFVAARIGLGAPLLEAWLRGEPVVPYLRPPLLPILITMVLVVTCTAVSNSSMLHPNRQRDTIAANEIVNSPARAQLFERLDSLGLSAAPVPYTGVSLALSYLAGAIGGEFYARLFEVSVVALLLVQIFGNTKNGYRFLWAAILIVALMSTAFTLWARHENTLMIAEVFRGLGLPFRVDPYWLVVLRVSIPILPPALAFGYLYVRHGIESAIAASFAGSMITHWFMDFIWIRFAL